MSIELPLVSAALLGDVLDKTDLDSAFMHYKEKGLVLPGSVSLSLPEKDNNSDNQLIKELVEAKTLLQRHKTLPGIFVSTDNRAASLLQTFIAKQGVKEDKIIEIETAQYRTKEVKFDEHDWRGWAGSFFTWWKKIVKHPWLDIPSDKKIANTARIGILGDWGTGLYGAPVCAKSIEADRKGYNVLLHLGDVYYSGDKAEIKERFLAFWPDASKTVWGNKDTIIHRACNSNHEMYTGGHSYYNFTLSKFEQSASYFALHNDYWILAGLDTGYLEGDLMGQQVEWLENLIAKADGRRIILFSHHQPFSWFEKGYQKITTKLNNILQGKKIFAWYWGHEHRCILYDQHPLYGLYGRCVGHSGYPYFRDNFSNTESEMILEGKDQNLVWKLMPAKTSIPSARILDGPNPYVRGYVDQFGPNGYITLEFENQSLIEIVHSTDGNVLYQKAI
jgi:hypothetical protein